MRFTFLFIVLFLSASGINAQNFEAGLNAGTTFNTLVTPNFSYYKKNADLPHTYSVCLLRNTKKWQYGIMAEYSYNYYSYNFKYYYSVPGNNYSVEPSMNIHVDEYSRDEIYRLFVNRRITAKQFEFYGGGYFGDISRHVGYWEGSSYQTDNANFLSTGIQAGCTWFASKHIGINIEAADAYIFTLRDAFRGGMNYPVTLGIRYRL